MPGLTADAPDRVTDSHRYASAPRSPPHKADKVALEELLKGTRITAGRQCTLGSTIPPANMLFNPYRCIKEGWGAHLGEHPARGTLSLPEASYTLSYLELRPSFWPLKNSKTSGSTILLS